MPTRARLSPINAWTRLSVLALTLATAAAGLSQTPPAQAPPVTTSATGDASKKADVADFSSRLAAALHAENDHDYATAYKLYQQLLVDSPPDRDLLMQTAIAARGAGHPEEALVF